MEIYNRRSGQSSKSTLGILSFEDNIPFGFIIEDPHRDVKIKDITRIPAGRYKLGICKKDTPLTLKHRNNPAYKGWFKYHIEVLNVPDFTGIYFHLVQSADWTSGCQGGAKNVYIENGQFVCKNSKEMMKAFYEIVYPILELGKEDVWYNVIDEAK